MLNYQLLSRGFLNLPCLAVCLLTLGFVVPLCAQTSIPKKVHTPAPPSYSDIAIEVIPKDLVQVIQYKPASKEIDAEARLALKAIGAGNDRIARPFWVGQADFLARAKKHLPDGSKADLYQPQKYIWQAMPAPSIPTDPNAAFVKLLLTNIAAGATSQTAALYRMWEDISPQSRDLIELGAQDAVGYQEIAADGRPLDELRVNTSRANKHFYWDFGESQSAFPHTTNTQVSFTSEGAPDARGPAVARINWHLPTRTIYDVEIGLWNWTTDEPADPTTVSEWEQKILQDDDFAKRFGISATIDVVGMIGPGKIVGAGKIGFRVLTSSKVDASIVKQVASESVLSSMKRPVIGPNGIAEPLPLWHKTHSVIVKVSDVIRRGEPVAGRLLEKVLMNGAEEAAKGKRDDEGEEYIDPQDISLYLYYKPLFSDGTPSRPEDSRWEKNPNNKIEWKSGYYLTDMPPNQAEVQSQLTQSNGRATSGQHAAALRAGQHSFAMFGHPYEWENGAKWIKIKMGAVLQDGTEVQSRLAFRSISRLLPNATNDKRVTYRNWPYRTYLCDEPITRLFDTRRVSSPQTVSFQSGTPSDNDVPGVDSKFPGITRGTWYEPGTKIPLQTPIDAIDDATGLKRQANADWVPDTNEYIGKITNVDVNGDLVSIRYRNGYPDFSPYAINSPNLLPLQHGNESWSAQGDFGRATTIVGKTKNSIQSANVTSPNPSLHTLPAGDVHPKVSPNGSGPSWVWHHHQNMRMMQLVPSSINTPTFGGAPHEGGASWSKNARW